MENSKVVAKVLYNMYQDRFRCPMDEMKMHKLMYFAQRESLMMLSRLVDTFFSRTSWTMLLYAENHSISVA